MTNPVDALGINGRPSTTARPAPVDDRIYGGDDNDTFWGGDGNDIIEGGDGADIALGGEGNDIITDLAGDDVPKGGPGNDAIDAGPGLDIIMGGDGNDFTNGGANINETFGGAGDDFAIAGEGDRRRLRRQRRRLGGGRRPARPAHRRQLHAVLRRPQPARPRHPHRPGRRRRLRRRGWRRHRSSPVPASRRTPVPPATTGASVVGDPQPQNADLHLVHRRRRAPVVPEVRDKFNEVEALSGWNLDDTLRGDDVVPSQVGGGGFIGCDALDRRAWPGSPASMHARAADTSVTENVGRHRSRASATHDSACSTGNVLGRRQHPPRRCRQRHPRGSRRRRHHRRRPLPERAPQRAHRPGRPGDRDRQHRPDGEQGRRPATSVPAPPGMTLQQAVFAGLVDPGNIVAVREILSNSGGEPTDVALFSGARTEYDITANADGSVTVAHTGGRRPTASTPCATSRCSGSPQRSPDVAVSGASMPAVPAESDPGGGQLVFGDRVITVASAPLPITVTNTGTRRPHRQRCLGNRHQRRGVRRQREQLHAPR